MQNLVHEPLQTLVIIMVTTNSSEKGQEKTSFKVEGKLGNFI